MGIQFACTKCGSGFSVESGDAGRLCKCAGCGTVMRVPSGGILVANKGADDFESEPTLKAEILGSGGGKGAGLGMGLFKDRLVIGFIVGGIAVLAMGVREVQLWSA